MNFDRNPTSQFGDVLQMAQGRPVFTADFYAVDGISNKVASFIDWNDFGHLLVQATSASQVAIPAAHADYAGKLCATFDATVNAGAGNYYTSNKPTLGWKYTVDGSGMHSCLVLTPTVLAVSNYYSLYTSGTVPGHFLNQGTVSVAGDAISASAFNDSGALGFTTAGPAGSVAINVGTYYSVNWVKGINPEFALRKKSVLLTSGLYTGAAANNNPASALVLGRRPIGIQPSSFRFRALTFGPFFGPAEISAEQSWIQADTGIAP